jgi:hypothetical protein
MRQSLELVGATCPIESLWKMLFSSPRPTVSNRVSSNRSLRCRERIFEGRDKELERGSEVQERRCRDRISLNNLAHSGASRREPGNLHWNENAWWAREDSNFPTKSIACRKVGHLVIPWNHYVSYPECPTKFLIKRRSSLHLPCHTFLAPPFFHHQPNTTLADFERRGIPKSVFL